MKKTLKIGIAPRQVIARYARDVVAGRRRRLAEDARRVNGRAFSIIGVAPPGFFGAKVAASDKPDMWLPPTAIADRIAANCRLSPVEDS